MRDTEDILIRYARSVKVLLYLVCMTDVTRIYILPDFRVLLEIGKCTEVGTQM